MRLWQGAVLTVAVISAFAACWLVRDVSSQQNSQMPVVAAAQPVPGLQPPSPGGPMGQPPFGGPMMGQPPVPSAPKPPFTAPPPNVAISANSEFVYLVWGNMLLQFDAKTLKLLRKVPLRGEFPVEKPEKLDPSKKWKQEQPKEEKAKRDQPNQ